MCTVHGTAFIMTDKEFLEIVHNLNDFTNVDSDNKSDLRINNVFLPPLLQKCRKKLTENQIKKFDI